MSAEAAAIEDAMEGAHAAPPAAEGAAVETRASSAPAAETTISQRCLTLWANPAATLDPGWQELLAQRTQAPVSLLGALAGEDALSRLLFDAFDLGWPQGDPFATAAGRALLLSRAETRRFAVHLGLACHRDWYHNLIDGRLRRRLEDAYDSSTCDFLAERENPFASAADVVWRDAATTLALGQSLWETLLGSIDRGWILRLRLKLPPAAQAARDGLAVPRLDDAAWPARLLERLFPRCRWLLS